MEGPADWKIKSKSNDFSLWGNYASTCYCTIFNFYNIVVCKAKCNQSSVNFTYFLIMQKVWLPIDWGVKWTVAFYTGGALKNAYWSQKLWYRLNLLLLQSVRYYFFPRLKNLMLRFRADLKENTFWWEHLVRGILIKSEKLSK